MVTLEKLYTYEMIEKNIQTLANTYPKILTCQIIGESYDNRNIYMTKMGKGPGVLFCTAGIHGRELINPAILLKLIEEYAMAYTERSLLDQQYPVYDLLREFSICFIPVVNPDGYEIAMSGFSAIRNPILRQAQRIRRIPAENWKYNARGVDINRNFPCKSYVRKEYYDQPGSEIETKVLMRIFRKYPSVGYIDFHSRGKIIYYYRQAMPFAYNQRSYRLARYLQKLSNYSLGKKDEEMMSALSGGNSVQYYSETLGCPAITVETVEEDAAFPLDSTYLESSYHEVRYIPLGILSQL